MPSQSAGGIVIPPEYVDREQSYLKHLVLDEYLDAWSHKLGSAARYGRTKLWYVDTFAGPWEERHPQLQDTSFAIALTALRVAAQTWKTRGFDVDVSAIFVEKNHASFCKLRDYVTTQCGVVSTRALHGEFGDHAAEIQRLLGNDAAFIFVDPTGWKGAAMSYIAPLVSARGPRDVLINVMYDHMNRQKDREAEHVRQQMRDFFGLHDRDLPPDLGEEDLFDLYRSQLKKRCNVTHAADLSILHPQAERTKFRLVIGGKNPKVLQVFRDVESRVIGHIAGAVRDDARHRNDSMQPDLFNPAPAVDYSYSRQHAADAQKAKEDILEALHAHGATTFESIWPAILEKRHLTLSDLRRLVAELASAKRICVANRKSNERAVRDEHLLALP